MNAMTKLHLTAPLPRIAKIDAMEGLTVRVLWASGIRANRTDVVDLSPLINSLKFYRPIRSNPGLFGTIHLIERGTIVAWGDNEAIDMAADSIEQLAEETMTAGDFGDFLRLHKLTHNEVAVFLGRSRRQIENYLSGREQIPRVVVLACFGLSARLQKARARFFNVIQVEPQKTDIDNISRGLATGTVETFRIMKGQKAIRPPPTATPTINETARELAT